LLVPTFVPWERIICGVSPKSGDETARFVELMKARLATMTPQGQRAFMKSVWRVMRDLAAAVEAKSKAKEAKSPQTWRLEKSSASPTAPSQQMSPALRKLTTAKRLGLRPPSRADEET
jgi:hypothetical protein